MLEQDDLKLARYETKFVSQQAEFFRFKNWLLLNPYGFYSPYGKRTVNNIYFDNVDCDSYWENLTGCASRTKIRLRWYGTDPSINNATLEIKSKKNRLGFKQSRQITFEKPIRELTYKQIVNTISSQLTDDFLLRFNFCQTPILINHYSREYFLSNNKIVRATVDKNLSFYDQRDKQKPNIHFRSLAPEISIMEVKTPANEINHAVKILEHVNFTPSKSSKYVIGVQSILGFQ